MNQQIAYAITQALSEVEVENMDMCHELSQITLTSIDWQDEVEYIVENSQIGASLVATIVKAVTEYLQETE